MSLTLCKLHFTPRTERTIYLSQELIRKLRLTGRRSMRIRLGTKTAVASVKTLRKKGSYVYLSSALRDLVKVPMIGHCYIAKKEGEIQLGPLIGIMAAAPNRSSGRPFGSNSGLIRQYLAAGSNQAFYFGFTPGDIDWNNETVAGYFIDAKGRWLRKVVPLPDVVHNRVTDRKIEGTSSMEQLKQRLNKKNIPLFNWSFFSKSEIYDMLKDEASASRYVPESHINPTPERLRDMLRKHSFVYLKPASGSLGRGIYRITSHPNRGYFVRYRKNNSNVLQRYKRFDALVKSLGGQRGRLRRHVIQQGIRLIEIDDCPIDFRFHMNKNGKNEWVVSGIGAKKAGRGSVTTHVRTGGQVVVPDQVMEKVFGFRGKSLLDEAKQVAIRLAEAIERKNAHLIGELGFDLGIDRDGEIWMFEANAKPGRSIFKHPELKSQGKDALKNIFEHCLYLSDIRKGET